MSHWYAFNVPKTGNGWSTVCSFNGTSVSSMNLIRSGALFLIALDHFFAADFGMGLNRFGRGGFVSAIHHHLFQKLRFAARFGSQSGLGGESTARCTEANSKASPSIMCSAVSPTDQRSGADL